MRLEIFNGANGLRFGPESRYDRMLAVAGAIDIRFQMV